MFSMLTTARTILPSQPPTTTTAWSSLKSDNPKIQNLTDVIFIYPGNLFNIKRVGCVNQCFGSVTFKPEDPDLLDTDPPENALNSKYQSGKFINSNSDNRIP